MSWFDSLHDKRFSRLARVQSDCGAQSGSGVQSECGVLSGPEVQPACCSNSTKGCLHGILRSWREAGDVKVAWNRTSIPLYAIMAWYLIDVTQLPVCHDIPCCRRQHLSCVASKSLLVAQTVCDNRSVGLCPIYNRAVCSSRNSADVRNKVTVASDFFLGL